jgi:HK97 gp10 family phage protein
MAALERKEKEYSDRLEAASTAGALVVENAARNNAPYLTGTLKDSIGHETAEKSAKQCLVAVGPGSGTDSDEDIGYAVYQEFGTSKMPAHPYLRPALDENRAEVVDVMAQVLRDTE